MSYRNVAVLQLMTPIYRFVKTMPTIIQKPLLIVEISKKYEIKEGMSPTTKIKVYVTIVFSYARRRHKEIWIKKIMLRQLFR